MGQMSIVTQLPNILAGLGPASVVDQRIHDMVYIHKQGGGGQPEKGGGWEYRWLCGHACVYKPIQSLGLNIWSGCNEE